MMRWIVRILVAACLAFWVVTAIPLAANAAPEASTSAPATQIGRVHPVEASGDFTVALDVMSIRLQPSGLGACSP
jgi:hypothetical protein